MDEARRAPSLHNGQHFRLVVDGDSATVLFERARGIPVGDSTGRFLLVALGALPESLRIALGRRRCAPAGGTGAVLPIARVRIGEALGDEARAEAAARGALARGRQTNRRRYDGVPIPPGL